MIMLDKYLTWLAQFSGFPVNLTHAVFARRGRLPHPAARGLPRAFLFCWTF